MQSIGKLFDTSIAHYEKKEYPEAEKAVDELLGLHPDFQRAQFMKAVILEETGRKDEAERHYAKSGNRFTLWFRLGRQLEEKDPERAIRYYERVGGYDPRSNQLWFSLGSLYERQGELKKAKDCFGKMRLLREFLSRVAIPLGFLILLVAGGYAMVKHGDKGLGTVVFASAIFCLFWLKRDGGKALQMLMKKKQYSH
jgi:tetratricopeptide (TPR) repeat protein